MSERNSAGAWVVKECCSFSFPFRSKAFDFNAGKDWKDCIAIKPKSHFIPHNQRQEAIKQSRLSSTSVSLHWDTAPSLLQQQQKDPPSSWGAKALCLWRLHTVAERAQLPTANVLHWAKTHGNPQRNKVILQLNFNLQALAWSPVPHVGLLKSDLSLHFKADQWRHQPDA